MLKLNEKETTGFTFCFENGIVLSVQFKKNSNYCDRELKEVGSFEVSCWHKDDADKDIWLTSDMVKSVTKYPDADPFDSDVLGWTSVEQLADFMLWCKSQPERKG